MATFVKAGNLRINLDTVAYVEKVAQEILVHFVGRQPSMLTLRGEAADAFRRIFEESGEEPERWMGSMTLARPAIGLGEGEA